MDHLATKSQSHNHYNFAYFNSGNCAHYNNGTYYYYMANCTTSSFIATASSGRTSTSPYPTTGARFGLREDDQAGAGGIQGEDPCRDRQAG